MTNHAYPDVESVLKQPGPIVSAPRLLQHWDKIHFRITGQVPNFPAALVGQDLDIKVLDDPNTVADLKGKVQQFFLTGPRTVDPTGIPPIPPIPPINIPRNLIEIKDVDYEIVVLL